jgi:hypothetical protein
MLYGSGPNFITLHGTAERKAPCEPFVDNARGVVGFGLTYGEYSYNHQPLFGATLPSSQPAYSLSAGMITQPDASTRLPMGSGIMALNTGFALGNLPY